MSKTVKLKVPNRVYAALEAVADRMNASRPEGAALIDAEGVVKASILATLEEFGIVALPDDRPNPDGSTP